MRSGTTWNNPMFFPIFCGTHIFNTPFRRWTIPRATHIWQDNLLYDFVHRLALRNKQTNSMKQSPSWEANSYWRNTPHFMKPKGSLPHSQAPANCPYPEPDQSSSCPQSHFLKIHLNPICIQVFQLASFSQVCPPKPCMYLSFSPYVLPSLAHLILLDLIAQITFGEEYRL